MMKHIIFRIGIELATAPVIAHGALIQCDDAYTDQNDLGFMSWGLHKTFFFMFAWQEGVHVSENGGDDRDNDLSNQHLLSENEVCGLMGFPMEGPYCIHIIRKPQDCWSQKGHDISSETIEACMFGVPFLSPALLGFSCDICRTVSWLTYFPLQFCIC